MKKLRAPTVCFYYGDETTIHNAILFAAYIKAEAAAVVGTTYIRRKQPCNNNII